MKVQRNLFLENEITSFKPAHNKTTEQAKDIFLLVPDNGSLLKTGGLNNGRSKVGTYFDLSFEKRSIDLDLGGIEVIPEDQRTDNPIYRSRLLRLVKRYQDLVKRVYNYWTNDRQSRSHEYSSLHYQELVKEIWDKSLSLIEEFEAANPDDKWLRRDTVNDLYFDVSFSDLLFGFGGYFYSDLASQIRDERA